MLCRQHGQRETTLAKGSKNTLIFMELLLRPQGKLDHGDHCHGQSIHATRYFYGRFSRKALAFPTSQNAPLRRANPWVPELYKHPSFPLTLHKHQLKGPHKFVDWGSISLTPGATQICGLGVHIPNPSHSICGLFGVDTG